MAKTCELGIPVGEIFGENLRWVAPQSVIPDSMTIDPIDGCVEGEKCATCIRQTPYGNSVADHLINGAPVDAEVQLEEALLTTLAAGYVSLLGQVGYNHPEIVALFAGDKEVLGKVRAELRRASIRIEERDMNERLRALLDNLETTDLQARWSLLDSYINAVRTSGQNRGIGFKDVVPIVTCMLDSALFDKLIGATIPIKAFTAYMLYHFDEEIGKNSTKYSLGADIQIADKLGLSQNTITQYRAEVSFGIYNILNGTRLKPKDIVLTAQGLEAVESLPAETVLEALKAASNDRKTPAEIDILKERNYLTLSDMIADLDKVLVLLDGKSMFKNKYQVIIQDFAAIIERSRDKNTDQE